jgi:hypothetical protein
MRGNKGKKGMRKKIFVHQEKGKNITFKGGRGRDVTSDPTIDHIKCR